MMVLLGSVGLLLIITCVNVTILLLARGSRRRGELAMRAALGAGRRRLVRHLMVENLLLAGLGGVVSIVVARLGLAILMAAGPAALPRIDEIALDGTAVGFALTITLLIGAVVGLAPAFAHTGGQLHQATRDAGRGAIGRHRSARRALVITEVTLATVLLVGSGLLLRSTRHLFSVATGFEASNAVVMKVHTTLGGDASADRFFEDALSAVRAVPGVQSAAFTNQLPLSGDVDIYGAALDRTEPNEGLASPAYRYVVSPGYFQTMGIRLLEGRALESSDVAGAPAIAVVSQAMATHLFEGRDALGTRFYFGPSDEPFTVVGVVDNVKQESLESDFDDAVYVASVQWLWGERVRWIVVAAERDPLALVPAIRHAVWSVDGDQPIVRVQAVDELVERSQSRRRFAQAVLQAFAFMAVLLSGLGLYGLLSGNVGERMREIGVRRVLGAPPESILTLVVGQGMTLAGIGIAIGLLGAALASAALVPLLFGVSRVDLVTYAAVAVLLTAVSAAACWIPAARAVRADPLQTLRAE
jgi:predicted permease